jgi:ubiquinone/menaquinone biosynthesis C-methylase UbiE
MTIAERAYYEQRAPEYDDWYRGTGLYAARPRPGWHEEVERLVSLISSLPACTWLDVACGTGFLTRHLQGTVIALDQSAAMLHITRQRLAQPRIVQGDGLNLPFRSNRFACLVASHFYGHLREPERVRFLAEARRVASGLLIVDAAWRPEVEPEQVQERVLNDGSRHTVYKRYFTPEGLISELGHGMVLHAERWFVAVSA